MGIEKIIPNNDSIESLFDFDKFRGEEPEQNTEKIFEDRVDTDLPPENNDKEKTAEEATEELKKGFDNLNPRMVIDMFDMVISRGFSMLTNVMGYECSYKDYALDEKEKKFLVPFVESVVMDWLKTLKPRDVLIVAVCIMYGSKGFEVVMTKPKRVARKKAEKKSSVNVDITEENEIIENSTYDTGRRNKDGSLSKKRGPKG